MINWHGNSPLNPKSTQTAKAVSIIYSNLILNYFWYFLVAKCTLSPTQWHFTTYNWTSPHFYSSGPLPQRTFTKSNMFFCLFCLCIPAGRAEYYVIIFQFLLFLLSFCTHLLSSDNKNKILKSQTLPKKLKGDSKSEFATMQKTQKKGCIICRPKFNLKRKKKGKKIGYFSIKYNSIILKKYRKKQEKKKCHKICLGICCNLLLFT